MKMSRSDNLKCTVKYYVNKWTKFFPQWSDIDIVPSKQFSTFRVLVSRTVQQQILGFQ